MQAMQHASETFTLALKPRVGVTRSKKNRGINGPTKRTDVLQNFLKKRNKRKLSTDFFNSEEKGMLSIDYFPLIC